MVNLLTCLELLFCQFFPFLVLPPVYIPFLGVPCILNRYTHVTWRACPAPSPPHSYTSVSLHTAQQTKQSVQTMGHSLPSPKPTLLV